MRLIYIFIALLLLSCTSLPGTADLVEEREVPATPVGCDTCFYPVVMVHGFLASGDTWTKFQQLFHTNGYKSKFIYAFDWNSLNQLGGNTPQLLDQFIDQVLQETGASQVRLIGHSAGGGVCYTYLSDPARAAKVDGYVHIGSSVQTSAAGPGGTEPTLNIWSTEDEIVQGGNISGAQNVQLSGKDHYQVATSAESFTAVWQFFHNTLPPTTEIKVQGPLVCVAGKVLYFGENTPLAGATVQIWETDPATGERVKTTPDFTFTTDASGKWGPENIKASTTFEFVAIPASPGQRTIHYFREPIIHLNSF
ncbi:MAG: alpha/beta fold hydrolase, partial [Bacteroidota bacterium]